MFAFFNKISLCSTNLIYLVFFVVCLTVAMLTCNTNRLLVFKVVGFTINIVGWYLCKHCICKDAYI